MEKISRKKLSGLIIICVILSIAFLAFYFMYTPPAPGISRHDRALLDIYGTKIVWNDYRNGNWDIYLYDLETDSEIQITTNEADQRWPQIYDDKIVYLCEKGQSWSVCLYDLLEGNETVIANNENYWSPKIYGDIVVWKDYWGNNIYKYDIRMETLKIIVTNSVLKDD